MKKFITIILVITLVLSIAGCAGGTSTTAATTAATTKAGTTAGTTAVAKQTVKIGFFNPLTGSASLLGTGAQEAAILAVEQINKAGSVPGVEFQLIPYDDKSSPEESVKIVTKMIQVDKVDAIIGSLHSGNVQAVGQLAEDAKIPLLGIGTSPQWLQKGWTYLFRPTLNTYYSSLAAVQICQKLKLTKMAIFHSQDEYGKNGKDNMIKLCEQNSITNLGVESMKPGDTDFTGQCTKIAQLKPDVVYVIAVSNELPAMVKQLRSNGYDGYIVGEQSLGSIEVKDVAGSAANKIIYGALYTMPTKPEDASTDKLKKFFTDYKARFGRMCDTEVAGRAYDAMYILAEAYKKTGGKKDGTAIRDAIASISSFEGLQGTFNFVGKNGEGLDKSRLYIIENVKDVLLEDYMKAKGIS